MSSASAIGRTQFIGRRTGRIHMHSCSLPHDCEQDSLDHLLKAVQVRRVFGDDGVAGEHGRKKAGADGQCIAVCAYSWAGLWYQKAGCSNFLSTRARGSVPRGGWTHLNQLGRIHAMSMTRRRTSKRRLNNPSNTRDPAL